MTDIGKAFAELVSTRLEELGTNAFAFEKQAGLPVDAIRSVIRDDDKRAVPKISRAKEICDLLDLEFFIGRRRTSEVHEPQSNRDDIAFIELHNVQASAGSGRLAQDLEIVSSLGFPMPWLSRHGVNPDRASLIFVEGDSMYPTIRSGSVALVNHNRRKVTSKRVYAFREGEDLYVKRLEMVETGILLVTSDNPDHPSRVIRNHDLEAVSIIGEVVWTGRSW